MILCHIALYKQVTSYNIQMKIECKTVLVKFRCQVGDLNNDLLITNTMEDLRLLYAQLKHS